MAEEKKRGYVREPAVQKHPRGRGSKKQKEKKKKPERSEKHVFPTRGPTSERDLGNNAKKLPRSREGRASLYRGWRLKKEIMKT